MWSKQTNKQKNIRELRDTIRWKKISTFLLSFFVLVIFILNAIYFTFTLDSRLLLCFFLIASYESLNGKKIGVDMVFHVP